MRILITGAHGFIARNLISHLSRDPAHEIISLCRGHSERDLRDAVDHCDFIFHLAGSNRPVHESDFLAVNADFTSRIADLVRKSGKSKPIVFTSSVQVAADNPYGRSKLVGEKSLLALREATANPVCIYRLPNVFGKWGKPNYNSVVATFCHNIANGLPITIHDRNKVLNLVYIDDVIKQFVDLLTDCDKWTVFGEVNPVYSTSLGLLADQVQSFRNCRSDLIVERVGAGLTRALYATYMSYLSPGEFSYELPRHGDARGVFVEMLKTHDSGQFSFFTAGPGVTRGGHYHHTKSEKFLIVRGYARFRFKHIDTNEDYELLTSHEKPTIVETIPGWAHDITNIGADEMIVLLWANELFDRSNPDTYARVLS